MSERTSRLFSIDGKVAVVTGGSRGIGEMIAGAFVDAGVRVYISSRKAAACEAVAAALATRGTCIALPEDLSRPEGAERLAAQVAEREPRVHILVNNAAAIWEQPLEEHPMSAFDRVWDLNVKGLFHLTRLLLPQLRAAASADDPARVINIGSADGTKVPSFEIYSYAASKAGVHMLTRHLAIALAPDHITVNCIAPGLFESNMTKLAFDDPDTKASLLAETPLRRIGTPVDMGGTAIFLASPAGAYLTGAIIPLDGGMTAHG